MIIVGLRVTFNIEQDEYVGELTSKAGVRVTVHPRDSMPFPENNGIDIGPGEATAVGIRKVGTNVWGITEVHVVLARRSVRSPLWAYATWVPMFGTLFLERLYTRQKKTSGAQTNVSIFPQ